MASMFETDRFKALLTDAVTSEAGARGMREYETDIITFLQRRATENESVLMERELRKSATSQRGRPDALISAGVLIREASRYATADRRTTLRLVDVEAAYRAKFCQVWPFCRQ